VPTALEIALVVAAWALLPFPLAVLVGRALRDGAALSTPGCEVGGEAGCEVGGGASRRVVAAEVARI